MKIFNKKQSQPSSLFHDEVMSAYSDISLTPVESFTRVSAVFGSLIRGQHLFLFSGDALTRELKTMLTGTITVPADKDHALYVSHLIGGHTAKIKPSEAFDFVASNFPKNTLYQRNEVSISFLFKLAGGWLGLVHISYLPVDSRVNNTESYTIAVSAEKDTGQYSLA